MGLYNLTLPHELKIVPLGSKLAFKACALLLRLQQAAAPADQVIFTQAEHNLLTLQTFAQGAKISHLYLDCASARSCTFPLGYVRTCGPESLGVIFSLMVWSWLGVPACLRFLASGPAAASLDFPQCYVVAAYSRGKPGLGRIDNTTCLTQWPGPPGNKGTCPIDRHAA